MLRAHLARARESRRLRRKQAKKFQRWLAAHPGGTYAEFYADDARRRIAAGDRHPTLGITTIDQEAAKERAQRMLSAFKRAGCMPHHVFVDYGCGSLWVGEAFMEYLEPGNYIGLDISDAFFTEGLTRLPPELVASRKPTLRVIDDQALGEVRARKPGFIASIAVVHHVPPSDLAAYFARIVSLAGPDTRIEITQLATGLGLLTKRVPPRRWQHGRFAIRSALAPLGYAAEYRPARRILPGNTGFSLVRR